MIVSTVETGAEGPDQSGTGPDRDTEFSLDGVHEISASCGVMVVADESDEFGFGVGLVVTHLRAGEDMAQMRVALHEIKTGSPGRVRTPGLDLCNNLARFVGGVSARRMKCNAGHIVFSGASDRRKPENYEDTCNSPHMAIVPDSGSQPLIHPSIR